MRGARYDLGRRKFGAVLGDGSQLGCGCVTEPGCLIAPNTHAYPLCSMLEVPSLERQSLLSLP